MARKIKSFPGGDGAAALQPSPAPQVPTPEQRQAYAEAIAKGDVQRADDVVVEIAYRRHSDALAAQRKALKENADAVIKAPIWGDALRDARADLDAGLPSIPTPAPAPEPAPQPATQESAS